MSLDTVIQAYLQGNTVHVAHLAEFCFLSGPRRFWNGSYKLKTGGHDWFGLRKLGSIEGLDSDGNGQAQTLEFSVSGVDTRLFDIARGADRTEYVGRNVRVYNQFLDDEWQPLGDPVARAAGIMDGLEISRQRAESGSTRAITITATNIFYARSAGSDSYYTSPDQRRRFPGDRGLQYIPDLQDFNLPFPW